MKFIKIFEDDFNEKASEKRSVKECLYLGTELEKKLEEPTHVAVHNEAFSTRVNLHIAKEQVRIENGKLTITALKCDDGFKGGRVAFNSEPIKRGKFEFTVLIPESRAGVIPRIRLVSKETEPYITAFDILCIMGANDFSTTSMHSWWKEQTESGIADRHVSFLGKSRPSPSLTKGEHTFTLELTGEDSFIYIDGERIFAADLNHAGFTAFHQSYYPEIELTAASNEIPAPEEPFGEPLEFTVKRVAVYKGEE